MRCRGGADPVVRFYGVVVGTVVVRTAVAADLDAVREVFRAASLSNVEDRAVLVAHPEVLVWPGTAVAEGWTRVAVDDDGAVVGFATAVPVGEEWELEDLFVRPERMRQGAARRLVQDMLVLAARAGVPTVRVSANPHAMAFYTAVGFLPNGTAETASAPSRACDSTSTTSR